MHLTKKEKKTDEKISAGADAKCRRKTNQRFSVGKTNTSN